ncbi:MAG: hypothetical protein M3P38_13550 [Chloroflexota bacterium]|nr:hypothetical protein [Chloroflexota bacterium]
MDLGLTAQEIRSVCDRLSRLGTYLALEAIKLIAGGALVCVVERSLGGREFIQQAVLRVGRDAEVNDRLLQQGQLISRPEDGHDERR